MSDWRENPDNIILCEGYHDRAFWGGFLLKFGCEESRQEKRRTTASEPEYLKGRHTFKSPDGSRLISVHPCGGKDQVRKALAVFLAGLATNPKKIIVVSSDHDGDAGVFDHTPSPNLQSLRNFLDDKYHAQVHEAGDGFQLDQPDSPHLNIYLTQWKSAEPANDRLPGKQTLERLVCAAMNRAYPDRAVSVKNFLDSRGGDAPAAGVKEFAYSHVAGWYANAGIEGFYRSIWSDGTLYPCLEEELRKIKLWDTMHAVLP